MRLSISEQFCNNFELMIPSHRCTVVGNPGGVSLVFLANSFDGGTWGCEKIRGGVVFYCIFMWKFFKNLYREYMRCPPPLPPVCIYVPSPLSIFIDYILMFSNNIPKSEELKLIVPF